MGLIGPENRRHTTGVLVVGGWVENTHPPSKIGSALLVPPRGAPFFAEESNPGASAPRAGIPPFKKREEKFKLTRAGIFPDSFPAGGGGGIHA